ncbi:MAG: hypothetical protein O3A84_03355 [Proteobacteria bacterium]|nr:hypothetical protein [Pseudomonadota bacterium]
MLEDLDRDRLIGLLEKLNGEDDAEVAAAARELHAHVTGAGVNWDEFIAYAEEDDEEDDYVDDDDADDDETTEAELSASRVDLSDDDSDLSPLTEEEKAEALGLIDKLMDNVSADTREELKDYKTDIAEGEFEQMDLKYLRAMQERLGKKSK